MTTRTQVDDVLNALEVLVRDITPLRTRAEALRREVADARKDYEQALHVLNDEAQQLNARKAALTARLKGSPSAPAPVRNAVPGQSGVPSTGAHAAAPTNAVAPNAAQPVATDARAERKRALADFIISVVDSAQEDVVRERLNVVLSDGSRDIGDMLEDLSWGPIWSARSEWESIDEQAARLEAWRASLTARLTHWRRELVDLEREGERYFLPEKRQRDRESWSRFLRDLASEQESENTRSKHEVEVLDRQWSARRVASEQGNG